jgi:hypothetical protein
VLAGDVAEMAVRPWRRAPRLAEGRPVAVAIAVVVATGVVCAGLSLAAVFVEPQSGAERAAGIGASVILPALFVGIWLVDALIVDAVAQLMGRPTLRRRYLEVSAFALPVLTVCEAVRLVQAVVDHAAGSPVDAVGNAVGYLYFAVLAWFVVVVTATVRAVYELPASSALAAALAPPGALAMLLMALLVVGSILHAAGVG